MPEANSPASSDGRGATISALITEDRERRHSWRLYQLFLIENNDADPIDIGHHVEWLSGQYKTIENMLEGKMLGSCICGVFDKPMSRKAKAAWRALQEKHAEMDAETIDLLIECAELDRDLDEDELDEVEAN